jgi:hypothetical protein
MCPLKFALTCQTLVLVFDLLDHVASVILANVFAETSFCQSQNTCHWLTCGLLLSLICDVEKHNRLRTILTAFQATGAMKVAFVYSQSLAARPEGSTA